MRFERVVAWLASTLITLCPVVFGLELDWTITPEDGYPLIGFSQDTSADGEIIFKYEYGGIMISGMRFLGTQLFLRDCKTPADMSSLTFTNKVDENNRVIEFKVHVNKSTISNSIHYEDLGLGKARITMCARVDYYSRDTVTGKVTSMNFHETAVDITMDLLSNFAMTDIAIERNDAGLDNSTAVVDYEVDTIYVDDTGDEILPEPYVQGSIFQAIVVLAEEDTAPEQVQGVFVDDILHLNITQPLGPGTLTICIKDGIPVDPSTSKVCDIDGKCRIKIQLPSKYFVDPEPNPLLLTGVAKLGFGTKLVPTYRSLETQFVSGGSSRTTKSSRRSTKFQQQRRSSEQRPVANEGGTRTRDEEDRRWILYAVQMIVGVAAGIASQFVKPPDPSQAARRISPSDPDSTTSTDHSNDDDDDEETSNSTIFIKPPSIIQPSIEHTNNQLCASSHDTQ